MTKAEHNRELRRLAGLPFAPASLDTHWEGLRDMPLADLAAAVGRAARTCERFPAPAELRQFADLERPPVLVKPSGRGYVNYCDDCDDTGWWSLWCDRAPWSQVTKRLDHHVQQCPREQCLYPHEWVKQCMCYHTNPALMRKRAAQARYAEQHKGKWRT